MAPVILAMVFEHRKREPCRWRHKGKTGSNGFALYVSNVIEEGDFSTRLPPAVWMTGCFTRCDARLDEITTADVGPGSMAVLDSDTMAMAQSSVGPTVFSMAVYMMLSHSIQ